jgi:hypothetical protein
MAVREKKKTKLLDDCSCCANDEFEQYLKGAQA